MYLFKIISEVKIKRGTSNTQFMLNMTNSRSKVVTFLPRL